MQVTRMMSAPLLLLVDGVADSNSNNNGISTRDSRDKRRAASGRRLVGRARDSRMVASLSEFLASRNNVIARYDKMDAVQVNNAQQDMTSLRHLASGRIKPAGNHQWRAKHQQQSGKRALALLRALVSRRQRGNRASLLISLMRAPAVLAALFSLALTASLLVLYTMSFAHHQRHLLLATSPALNNQSSDHRISSRHLASAGVQIARSDHDRRKDQDLNQEQDQEQEQKQDDGSSASPLPSEQVLGAARTECGTFVGSPDGAGLSFDAIPYASAPIGERRWRRPRPVWRDPQLCGARKRRRRRRPRHCAQLSPVTRRFTGHEDCLYLDVFTPRPATNQSILVPVLVYVHGGFLAHGSSGDGQVNWLSARPSGLLAAELGLVLVAFNYRLQALGFMTSGARRNATDQAAGANYGLWDQVTALTWVQRNIAAFGGDPNNVVLFGPDSASALPLALLSRHSQQQQQLDLDLDLVLDPGDGANLFRAVWLANPTLYYVLPYELAARHYRRLYSSDTLCANERHTNLSASDGFEKEQQLECLARMSAEQVTRHYLGQDDPTYRLDDQNCLPIHGIFADQFVTVDTELVQRSYPFLAQQEQQQRQQLLLTSKSSNDQRKVDLLLGSSAQAVEYWPCPRNLRQWQWTDFERYVATSLNSFARDTYKRASELYQFSTAESSQAGRDDKSSKNTVSPKEIYLSMVSDIRQVCPINELEDSLREMRHRVHRYIVDTRPSAGFWGSRASSQQQDKRMSSEEDSMNNKQQQRQQQQHLQEFSERPEFAFHNWDLLAFFGFELEPGVVPAPSDLKFQVEIRQSVKQFAYGQLGVNISSNDRSASFIRFSRDAERQLISGRYKADECAMWNKYLGRSYAWVS